jgi:hypothetical protein
VSLRRPCHYYRCPARQLVLSERDTHGVVARR